MKPNESTVVIHKSRADNRRGTVAYFDQECAGVWWEEGSVGRGGGGIERVPWVDLAPAPQKQESPPSHDDGLAWKRVKR